MHNTYRMLYIFLTNDDSFTRQLELIAADSMTYFGSAT